MRQRTHWTISALKDFETCPAKYRYAYLFEAADWHALGYKVAPATGSPAMQRGTDIHQTCEDYLLGKVGVEGLHAEISPAWRNMIVGLKDFDAIPEQQWELHHDWYPIAHPGELWVRMKIDAHYRPSQDTVVLIDFKTGKPYPQNIEQVEVYALGAFATYDEVDVVEVALWYLDSDEPHEKTFKREQAGKLARKWEQRAGRLLEAVKFPPRRNRFCDWCPFNARKGGPCTPPT